MKLDFEGVVSNDSNSDCKSSAGWAQRDSHFIQKQSLTMKYSQLHPSLESCCHLTAEEWELKWPQIPWGQIYYLMDNLQGINQTSWVSSLKCHDVLFLRYLKKYRCDQDDTKWSFLMHFVYVCVCVFNQLLWTQEESSTNLKKKKKSSLSGTKWAKAPSSELNMKDQMRCKCGRKQQGRKLRIS